MSEDVTITSLNDIRYDKYSKLKIISVYKLGLIYHCETKCGNYLWVEAHGGALVMCLSELSHKMGDDSEPVSKYSGRVPPDFEQIKTHMKWKIDDKDAWLN